MPGGKVPNTGDLKASQRTGVGRTLAIDPVSQAVKDLVDNNRIGAEEVAITCLEVTVPVL